MNNEPETITLRRLPPEHVLRRDVDLIAWGKQLATVGISAGEKVGNTEGSACYCRAEDYPAEYDKPAVDPGEGWRLLEPDELVQEGDEVFSDDRWRESINHNDKRKGVQSDGLAYRRRITTQPDRLTELRQQGERQAARIVELEEKLQRADDLANLVLDTQRDMQEQITQRDEQIAGLRARLAERADEAESLQSQVRSAEEALRVEKQRCDSTSIELDEACCERDHLKQQLKDAYERLDDILNTNINADQALAWLKVSVTLGECVPDWNKSDHVCARDAACNTIRLLAMQNKSLIEQSNKTHEANVELQRQVDEMATLSEQRSEMIDSLLGRVHELEATSQPLRWERRKPTEEECRERWILIEDGAYPPACTDTKDWEKMGAREICVLPPIAEPEQERRMITQRRWLVKDTAGWQEEWVKDGEVPSVEWSERISTYRTREVPE